MTWYVKWHEISNDIKAQRQWLFKIGPEPNATSSPFVNISVPKHSPSAPDILKTPVRMLNRDPVWVKGKWLLLFSYLYEPSVSCCYNQIYSLNANISLSAGVSIHSKSWISWMEKSADDLEFSAEGLSGNTETIKFALSFF